MHLKEGYIVCSSEAKKKLLGSFSNEKTFLDYTFLTIDELKRRLFFSIQKKATFVLMQKYFLSYDVVEDYLKYIYYVEDKFYGIPILDSLVKIKNTLMTEKLLDYDPLFKDSLRRRGLSFVGVNQSKELVLLQNAVEKFTKYTVLSFDKYQLPQSYSSFNTITMELLGVFTQIKQLLDQGIDLNHIFLVNCSDEYSFILNRIANSFKITIEHQDKVSVLGSSFVKFFKAKYYEYATFEGLLAGLKQAFSQHFLIKKVIDIINDYELSNQDYRYVYSIFLAEFKKINYPASKYDKAIIVTTIENNYFSPDDYVFYLGFNNSTSPRVYRNDLFIDDDILAMMGLDTSIDRNLYANDNLIEGLSHIKNLFLSFAYSSSQTDYLPSGLARKLGIKEFTDSIKLGQNQREDTLSLGISLDKFMRYGSIDDKLNQFDISDLSYHTYDNEYKMIDSDTLQAKLTKPIVLSYSTIKKYYACPFSYFAEKVLHLEDFQQNLAAKLGTYAHAILEDSYNDDFDFEASANNNLVSFTEAKEIFYAGVIKDLVKDVIDFNSLHEGKGQLSNTLREQKIELKLENDDLIFKGFIDKIKYTVIDNDVYAAIIDYKTGNDIVSLNNVKDGFNLQLPMYIYLLKNSHLFDNYTIHIIGIYLQKINVTNFDNGNKTILEQRFDSFKLQGFTSANISEILLIDPDFCNSDYIHSMAVTGKGAFYRYAKILNDKNFNDLELTCKELVENAYKNIIQGNFDIKPKVLGEADACRFCKYEDICFREPKDKVHIEKKSFLEDGDTNDLDV